ncbi:hypothetical protein [Streptomyces sp. MBT84]|uniref:hypothetical protein n=1 Tax=Streptomyces sp. MBT84 TaxID=1488414 RepID=UPI001C6E6921|nr:hypothetical protein [Streptomyces sp. MBT84]
MDTDATHIGLRILIDVVVVGDIRATVRDLLHHLAWPPVGTGASRADAQGSGH